MIKKGFLFEIEGPDGVGKTTLFHLLQEQIDMWRYKFESHNSVGVVLDSEPTFLQRELSATPKENWLRHLFLFWLQRRMAFSGRWGEMLDRNNILLKDRGVVSSCVYQALCGDIDPLLILDAHSDDIVLPNLCVLLRISEETAQRRLKARGKVRNGSLDDFDRDARFQAQVRQLYHNIMGIPRFRSFCVEVMAEDSPQEVCDAVWAVAEPRLNKWHKDLYEE